MFSVLDILAITNSVNSGNGRPEIVCHLFSSRVHASIASKSDSKVFELSDTHLRPKVFDLSDTHLRVILRYLK